MSLKRGDVVVFAEKDAWLYEFILGDSVEALSERIGIIQHLEPRPLSGGYGYHVEVGDNGTDLSPECYVHEDADLIKIGEL